MDVGGSRKGGKEKPAVGAPEHLHQQILDSFSSGVIAVGAEGAVLMSNQAACDHLGLPRGSVVTGRPVGDLPLPAPFLAVLREVMVGHQPVSRREIQLDRPHGSKKEIGLSGSLLQGAQPFNGAVFLFVDMTHRRALERAAELNRQLAQIGALTAGVVHELRNPLSVISGMAEFLQRKIEPDDARRRPVDLIAQEAKGMAYSIAQFLGFAKPFELTVAPCQPFDIAQRARALCETDAATKGVQIVVHAQGIIPAIEADAERLAQAIANIAGNAVHFAPVETGLVRVEVSRQGADVVFEITDNGPGLELKPGEDVFDPFFSKREGGTGLGLAICHRIVTAHAGAVSCGDSETGGAKFTVRVPIKKGALR